MRRAGMLLATFALAVGTVHAQPSGRGPGGQLLYPAKGQSPQQADRDRFECHDWARQQSGFDPTAMQAAPQIQPGTGSSASRSNGGIVAGAAGGAAIAEIANKDAGKGAAAGLLGAGLRQQLQQQKQLTPEQQQAMQQQAAQAQKRSTYDRGFAACMEARGYVVK